MRCQDSALPVSDRHPNQTTRSLSPWPPRGSQTIGGSPAPRSTLGLQACKLQAHTTLKSVAVSSRRHDTSNGLAQRRIDSRTTSRAPMAKRSLSLTLRAARCSDSPDQKISQLINPCCYFAGQLPDISRARRLSGFMRHLGDTHCDLLGGLRGLRDE
jgi:hypothetical protein